MKIINAIKDGLTDRSSGLFNAAQNTAKYVDYRRLH